MSELVGCGNSVYGCRWTGLIEDYEDHSFECGKFYCKCGKIFLESMYDEHQQQCSFYRCPDCRVVMTKSISKKHSYECQEKMVSCEYCHFFMKQRYLQDHQDHYCEDREKINICTKCKKNINKNEDYHVSNCTEKIEKCVICRKIFLKSEIANHLNEHIPVAKLEDCVMAKCVNAECQEEFENDSERDSHVKLCFYSETECQRCGIKLKNSDLPEHNKNIHWIANLFTGWFN